MLFRLRPCWAAALLLVTASAFGAQPDPPTRPASQPTSQQRAARQVRQEEHQHILAVIPNFETSYNRKFAPLTVKQKFQLDYRTMFDPFQLVIAGMDAGASQAQGSFRGYGPGPVGFAKRFGASYADILDGYFWGSGVLPSLMHEDPRFFRKNRGGILNRALYAAATTVWCRWDNGRWGPNYANVAGNFIAGGISNAYYPANDRGASLTLERGLTDLADQVFVSEFVEFLPSHLRRKHRTTH